MVTKNAVFMRSVAFRKRLCRIIIERALQPSLVRHVVDYVICLLYSFFDCQIVKKGVIYPKIFIAKFISVLLFQVWKR